MTTQERWFRPPSSPTIVGSAVATIVWSSAASSMASMSATKTTVTPRRERVAGAGSAAAAVDMPALVDQRPCHTGSRFSEKATAPSRASSEAKTGPEISPWRSQNSSSLQSNCCWRISLVASSASGPLAAIAAASSSAASTAAAGLGQAVDEPQLVRRARP